MRIVATITRVLRRLVPAKYWRTRLTEAEKLMSAPEFDTLLDELANPKLFVDAAGRLHYMDKFTHFEATGFHLFTDSEKRANRVHPAETLAVWSGQYFLNQ